MPPMGSQGSAEELETGESGPDVAYRWTIRTLYAVAIALNVWVLWDQLATDSDAARMLYGPGRVDGAAYAAARAQAHPPGTRWN